MGGRTPHGTPGPRPRARRVIETGSGDQTAPARSGYTGQHPGRAADLSGFLGQFVGFLVGFHGLPDTRLINVINGLEVKCRVRRVFLGVESSGEFSADKKHQEATRTYRRRRIGWCPVLDSRTLHEGGLPSVSI